MKSNLGRKGKWIGSLIFVLLIALLWGMESILVNKESLVSTSDSSYTKHYTLLAQDMNTSFWKDYYQTAKEEAEKDSIYLDALGSDLSKDYDLEDTLRMSLAAKVDGIFLCPDGSTQIQSLIDEASENKIPVITLLRDVTDSSRISFVGANAYELGRMYGQEILQQQTEDTRHIDVFFHSSENQTFNDVVFNQMQTRVNEASQMTSIQLEPYYISDANDFDAEEVIRDVFLQEDLPDIVVFMNETDTECAAQAIVDYNKVGEVTIIGSYASDAILEAVKKKLIAVTIDMDIWQLAQKSVDAMEEYDKNGYVNNYYNVSLYRIDSTNVDQYINQDSEIGDK